MGSRLSHHADDSRAGSGGVPPAADVLAAPAGTTSGVNVVVEEELITDEASLTRAALRTALSDDSEPWELVYDSRGVELRRKAVASVNGVAMPSIPYVYQSKCKIDMSAEELYEVLISNVGYRLLDPDSNPDDFNKPILGPVTLEGKDTENAQIEKAYILKPPMQFVVINVKRKSTWSFLSRSVLHKDFAGGSKYSAEGGAAAVVTAQKAGLPTRFPIYGEYKVEK